ncbi:MAG: arsenate reductase ArsC [Alphaproteobacteria bacterium]|jgi:arsenate reductase|nr:arsenate reductase ArsC [Alphaproteobacteria bacterium]
MSKQKVLFLCTANSARSQMAQALLRHKAGDRFEAHSAGVEPGAINPFARRAVEELGIDMAGQRAKGLETYLGRERFHYLIIVCDRAADRCPTTWPGLHEKLVWPFDDPAAVTGSNEQKLAAFRGVRDQIGSALDEWLAGLATPKAP